MSTLFPWPSDFRAALPRRHTGVEDSSHRSAHHAACQSATFSSLDPSVASVFRVSSRVHRKGNMLPPSSTFRIAPGLLHRPPLLSPLPHRPPLLCLRPRWLGFPPPPSLPRKWYFLAAAAASPSPSPSLAHEGSVISLSIFVGLFVCGPWPFVSCGEGVYKPKN